MAKIYLLPLIVIFSLSVKAQCPATAVITLTYIENFEDASGSSHINNSQIHCDNLGAWSFETTAQNGGRISFDLGYSHNGSKAATLDRDIGFQLMTNYLTGTLNLSAYDTSNNSHLVLDFWHLDHHDAPHPNDKVWIRGNPSENWIEIYDLDVHSITGTYVHANNLNISNAMKAAGQNFSSQFQIRFGQEDFRRASSLVGVDGRSFDDIRIIEDPCPLVGQFQFNPINANSGNFNFDGSGSFEVEYGPCGFTQGNGTTINGAAPLFVNNLNPQSCYEVYIRRNCQSNGFSSWSGPFSFSSACSVISAPYFENFDGNGGWTASSASDGSGDAISSCWSRIPSPSSYSWVVRTGSTPTSGTGPSGDHTTGTGNYLATETDNGPYFIDAEIYSPLVDLSALSVPQLQFYYHLFGDVKIDTLFVDVWSNGVWHNDVMALDQQVPTSSSPWLSATLHLSAYSDTVQIRWRLYNALGSNKRDGAIDDISFEEGLNCPTPIALSATNITDTTALLNWSSPAAGKWQIIYDTAGFDPSISGIRDSVTTLPFLLDSLSPAVSYDFYVIADCGLSGVSDTSQPYTLKTSCNQPFSAPYLQSFEFDADFTFPDCWTGIDPLSVNSFQVITASFIPAAHGSKFFYLSTFTSHTRTDTVMLISPRLKGIEQNDKQIRFKVNGPGTLDIVVVSLSAPHSDSGFVALDTLSISSAGQYEEFRVYLNSINGHNLTDEYIGLMFFANPSSFIYIDEIHYEVSDPCTDVANVILQSFSDTSATFSFSAQYDSIQYEWGLKGFSRGSGSMHTLNGSQINFNNLQPGRKYEFYIKNLCPIDSSDWQGPFEFSTLCAAPAPLTLPYLQNFEVLPADTFNLPGSIYCDSVSSLELIKPYGFAEGRAFINSTSGMSYSGNKAISLDWGASGSSPLNELYFTFNMSNYSVPHTFPIELSFYHQTQSGMANDSDKVFIRGSESAPWIEVSSVTHSFGPNNTYRRIGEIYIDSILSINGQSFSSAFQVRITERSSSLAIAGRVDRRTYDDFMLQEIFCEGPSNLIARQISSSSVTISWHSNAGGSIVEYGLSGFAAGQGTIIATTDTFAIISGLNPTSYYDIMVRDSCSTGQLSATAGPLTVLTNCLPLPPLTLPFYDGFEGLTGIHQHKAIFCEPAHSWKLESDHWNTRLSFTTDATLVDSGNTSATLDQATFMTTTPTYLILTVNLQDYINTPQINLSFSYLHHSQNNDPANRVWVRSTDTSDWVQIYDLDAAKGSPGIFHHVQNIDIVSPLVNNGQAINSNVQIRFGQHGMAPYNSSTTAKDGFTFDNIELTDLICAYPTNLNAAKITDSTATLSWTPTVGSTGFQQVWFGIDGFYQGPGTTGGTQIIATDSLFMGGLSPNTCYEYLVRAFCPPNNTSSWQGPYKFCTICTAVTAPYFENFDNVNLPSIPDCWREIDLNNDDLNTVIGTSHGVPIPSSPHAVELNDGNINGNPPDTAMIISPSFSDLPSGVNQIRFKVAFENGGTGSRLYVGTMSEPYNSSSFVPYDTLRSEDLTQTFTEVAIWMDNPQKIGSNTHIAFMHGSSNYEIYIDDFHYEPIPSCIEPSGMQAFAVTSSSAQLSWIPFSGGSQFQVSYGPSLTNPANGIIINSNGNNYNLTGLTPSTAYCFFVREICTAGDTSVWSLAQCFTTTCGKIVAPYLEDVESLPTGSPLLFLNCWETNSNTSPYWTVEVSDGSDKNTSNTGPLNDHTFAGLQGGKYFMLESNIAGDSAGLSTPWMNIASLTQAELSFWYFMHGNGIGALNTWADTGSGFFKVHGINGQQQSSITTPWLQALVPLNTTADSIRIKFNGIVGNTSPWQGDIALDDIGLFDGAVCNVPININSNGNGCSSMDLLWSGTGAISYELSYGIGLSNPANGKRIAVTAPPYTLTGLKNSSQYCVYIRQICAPGDTSAWSVSHCFNTSSLSFALPFMEDFENTNTGGGFSFDNCWNSSTNTAPNWIVESSTGNNTNTLFTGPVNDHTLQGLAAGKYVYLETTGGNQGDVSHLTSPWFDVSNARDLKLSYWYHMFGNTMGNLEVYINTGNGFTLLNTITAQQQNAQGDPWLNGLHNLPNTDSLQLRFTGIRGAGPRSDIALDDIELYDAAACPAPTSFSAISISCDSTSFSWNTGSSGSFIQYGPSGFSPGSGNWSPAFNNGTGTVSGLMPGMKYDFYLADTCMGDTSAFVGPLSITTDSLPRPVAVIHVIGDSAISGEVHYWLFAQANNSGVNYSWNFGNGHSASGDSVKAVFPNNGNYLISLIASSACGADTAHILVNVVVSLDEHAFYGLEIYPNPAGDQLKIVMDKNQHTLLKISDMSGRLVIEEHLIFRKQEAQQIDLSNLSPGSYTLELKMNGIKIYKILMVK